MRLTIVSLAWLILIAACAGPATVPTATVAPTQAAAETAAPPAEAPVLALLPEACAFPLSSLAAPHMVADPWHPEQLAGGGSAESGPFTFELWLACGTVFGQNSGGDAFSEVDGLGLIATWRYHGPDQDGSIATFSGIEPFVRQRGGGGPLSAGSGGADVRGLQFPAGVIPDLSAPETALRYVVKVRTPDGALSGAELAFTLRREPGGYGLADVAVASLPAEALIAAESDPAAAWPFPAQDPAAIFPLWGEVHALLDGWQAGLTLHSGWLHVVTKVTSPDGNGLYGARTEWLNESWFQLDEQGWIQLSISIETGLDGALLQQAYLRDGQTVNLTLGMASPAGPARGDLGREVADGLLSALRSGLRVERLEGVIAGQPTLIVAWTDAPQTGQARASTTRREGLDQATGARLFSETVQTSAGGEERLISRADFLTTEMVAAPPPEALALLGQ